MFLKLNLLNIFVGEKIEKLYTNKKLNLGNILERFQIDILEDFRKLIFHPFSIPYYAILVYKM